MIETPPGQNWVNVTEAAKIIGYHRTYVQKLANKLWKLPEEEREIKVVKRSSGYDLWLPDLMEYIKKPLHGPYGKRKPQNT
ncbi:MAG TPA: hypothetical protein VHL11_02775 [Phototrophicaceae bacterium]|jgi:hypothetical protein|nr:hypothetical protein [Phototrophicaceae bacterium]